MHRTPMLLAVTLTAGGLLLPPEVASAAEAQSAQTPAGADPVPTTIHRNQLCGTVTEASNDDDVLPTFEPTVRVDDLICMTFEWDTTATPDYQDGGTYADYLLYGVRWEFKRWATSTLADRPELIKSTAVSSDVLFVRVMNDSPDCDGGDCLRIWPGYEGLDTVQDAAWPGLGQDENSGLFGPQTVPVEEVALYLEGDSTVWDSTALPSNLDVAPFWKRAEFLVRSGGSDYAQAIATIQTFETVAQNRAPIALVDGPDKMRPGGQIRVSGLKSEDPDQAHAPQSTQQYYTLDYAWSADPTLTISSTTDSTITVSAPYTTGTFPVYLTVTDNPPAYPKTTSPRAHALWSLDSVPYTREIQVVQTIAELVRPEFDPLDNAIMLLTEHCLEQGGCTKATMALRSVQRCREFKGAWDDIHNGCSPQFDRGLTAVQELPDPEMVTAVTDLMAEL